jgi:large subunit ribosomal protein L23
VLHAKSSRALSLASIIIKPVVTEKTSRLGETLVFFVNDKADKFAIKDAVEALFSCSVDSVRTARIVGKPKGNARGRGRRALRKKAYITLKPGQSISIFEGV